MNAANRSSSCSKAEGERSNFARSAMQPAEIFYEELRHLVVEDPREARRLFLQLLDSGGPALDHFLGCISSPADGRLRHLVAMHQGTIATGSVSSRISLHGRKLKQTSSPSALSRALWTVLDTRSAGQTALAQEVARLTTAIGREMAQRERLESRVGNRAGSAGAPLPAAIFPRCRVWTTVDIAGRRERSAGTTTIFSNCPEGSLESPSVTYRARASAPRS